MAVAKTYWSDLPRTLQDIEQAQLNDLTCRELGLGVGPPAPGRIHYQVVDYYSKWVELFALNDANKCQKFAKS